jgi:hypothetical protein
VSKEALGPQLYSLWFRFGIRNCFKKEYWKSAFETLKQKMVQENYENWENQLLVQTECVRCPWALLRNKGSNINGVFFSLSLLLTLLFFQKGLS